ncbi:MAG: glutathione transferase [Pleurocapsa sp. SU_5_0]|nr:glutathione transferase [Pleurocapsa sp. SU_5_0]NJO96015.1 glutathione transferase [Pleurocapsa sp. CRU_1_2]
MLQGLNHLTLSVSCLETSFNFYTQILGCKPLARWKRGAYLLAGDLWLCLSLNCDRDRSKVSDYTHIAFTVSPESLRQCRQNIKQLNLKLWQENTSEGDSLYILDPDNHQLELHVGNWQTRLLAVQQNPYEDMIFYDLPEIN